MDKSTLKQVRNNIKEGFLHYLLFHTQIVFKRDKTNIITWFIGMLSKDDEGEEEEIDDEIEKVTGRGETVQTPRSVKSETGELIHPNDVLKALRAFVEENKQHVK